MSKAVIDAAVGIAIFIIGISLTIHKFGNRNRVALTAVAILSPLVAVFALFRVAVRIFSGKISVPDPCPPGLEFAEILVERQRQQMFGGPLREPSFATSWKRAYERELQKDTERVQRLAQRYLAIAA
jgi:hypothetical protein